MVNLRAGVNNIFDKNPPIIPTSASRVRARPPRAPATPTRRRGIIWAASCTRVRRSTSNISRPRSLRRRLSFRRRRLRLLRRRSPARMAWSSWPTSPARRFRRRLRRRLRRLSAVCKRSSQTKTWGGGLRSVAPFFMRPLPASLLTRLRQNPCQPRRRSMIEPQKSFVRPSVPRRPANQGSMRNRRARLGGRRRRTNPSRDDRCIPLQCRRLSLGGPSSRDGEPRAPGRSPDRPKPRDRPHGVRAITLMSPRC